MTALKRAFWNSFWPTLVVAWSAWQPFHAVAQEADFAAKMQRFQTVFSETVEGLQHPPNWIRVQPVNGVATLCVIVHDPRRQGWQGSELWQRWLSGSERNREWQDVICPGYTGETMFEYLNNDYRVRTAYNSCGRAVFRGVESIFGRSDQYQAVRVTIVYPRVGPQTYNYLLPTDALDLVKEGDYLNQAIISRMRITINDHPVTMDTYNGAMIDGHAVFNGLLGGRREGTPEADPNTILGRMNMAGVERIVLMTNRAWMRDCVALSRRSHGRVVLFADFSDHRGQTGADLHLDDFVQGLQTNAYSGIGVIYARNRNAIPLPPNSPAHMRLYELAARRNAPVAVDIDIVPNAPEWYARARGLTARQLGEEWADALGNNRQTRFIWCQSGLSTPEVVRRFLRTHPNLYCDISRPPLDWTLPLPEEWRRLMNDFPGRFLFGTGVRTVEGYEGESHYEILVERYRRVLSCLAPATAERIAYQNVVDLLGLKPLEEDRFGRP